MEGIGFLALGAVFGAGVAVLATMLAAKGRREADRARAAALEERLAGEREARAREVETAKAEVARLEAERSGLERQLREHAATTAHAQAMAEAVSERVMGLETERDAARRDSARAVAQASELERELALANARAASAEERLAQTVEAHARSLAERDESIAKADAILKQAFADASAKALNEALAGFDERARSRFEEEQSRAGERSVREKEEIERLLEPMHRELAELEAAHKRMEESRAKAEGALDEKLQRIQQTSDNLASALKKPGVRGAWGEGQLKSILESAGMVEGANYRVQHHTEEDGQARRTDFVILLPKGREVVIDSKAPLDQYWAAMNATGEEERTRCAQAHARSVRGHFKELKGKEYWRRYQGSPDCVFLFIPHEGAYQLACEHDKELLTDCHAHKIILANPMTLMSLVHVAAYALQEDRMKGDMERVRSAAVRLTERLGKVFELFARHRGHLNSAVESYNAVVASIESRLMVSARDLERLGVGDPKKSPAPEAIQAQIRILPVAEAPDEDAPALEGSLF